MDVATGARYELKMVIPATALPRLRARIRLHPAAFHQAYPPRHVNNIYFDTEDLRSAGDNLEGIARRVKIRLRWYGAGEVIRDGRLEFKCKQGTLGWKVAHPVHAAFDLTAEPWRAMVHRLRAAVPQQVDRELDLAHHPVLINRYRREYYESFDRAVRLTVDTDLSFHAQWRASRPNVTRPEPSPAMGIIEVKSAFRNRGQLPDVLRHFPTSVTKHSKYLAGVFGWLEPV